MTWRALSITHGDGECRCNGVSHSARYNITVEHHTGRRVVIHRCGNSASRWAHENGLKPWPMGPGVTESLPRGTFKDHA